VILQATERTPAEAIVVHFLVETPAIDIDDEAVVERVEHQPCSLFLKQAAAFVFLTCSTMDGEASVILS